MKTALKAKWVAALRSGNFKQFKGGRLKVDGGPDKESFCCLGVLCEISPAVAKRNIDDSFLSEDALTYVGFDFDTQENLANLNDKDGWGFKRIARYIEKHL